MLALLAAFSVSVCGGSRIADLYDNEKEISSDSNSFNLDGIQQNIEGEKWTASVERLEGMDTMPPANKMPGKAFHWKREKAG